MKKITILFITIFSILNLIPKETFAAKDAGYFVVTAYYSPLPNQKSYLTGDYKSEKRLNGQGIAGASGKGVFSGMLAAPKNYKFGTKIYLEGLGVGAVEDRGGAIVNAGQRGYSYDRIDVWVGYGDEGLQRALYWGKRTVKGHIVSSNTKTSLNYNNMPAPTWTASGLNNKMSVFTYGIGKESSEKKVKKLQELLKEIGLYNGEIDGKYNSKIIDIVYNFQIKNNLIEKGELYGAGYWGKDTRSLFKKMYLAGEFDTKKVNTKEEKFIKKEEKEDILKPKEITLTQIEKDIFKNTVKSKKQIKEVQRILRETGYSTGEISGEEKDLIDEVYHFQIENGIVDGVYDIGAGFYGPKTRKTLEEIYFALLERRELDRIEKLKEKLAEEKRKAEEEARKKELKEKYELLERIAYKKAKEKTDFIGNVKFNEVSHSVRELQIVLNNLGYLDTKDTAIFGNQTRNAVILFQVDNNIISGKNDIAAGIVGSKTIEVLTQILANNYLENKLALEENNDLKEVIALNNNKNEA